MTQRQYDTWQAWLAAQWNKPNRTDRYINRVAEYTAGKVLPPLQFGPDTPRTKEQIAAEVKDRAIARSGGKVIHRTITREQLENGNLGG